MPDADVSWVSVWLLGVSLGLTACTVTCLPFIGTWALGREPAGRGAGWDAAAFLGGRLLAYGLLGALAGGLGAWFVRQLAGGWGNAAIGLAAMGAGLALVAPRGQKAGCGVRAKAGRWSPFFLGLALTLIPCAPLATLLAACAGAGSVGRGWLLGSVFGLGTLLTPMLVFIPAIGGFARRLVDGHSWLAAWLRHGAALVLLLLGTRRLALVDPAFALFVLAIALPVGLALALRGRRLVRPDRVIRIVPSRG